MDALTLSSLLSSRLCHDLISPVGAASNGVEVCLEDPSSYDLAMPLIADSVAVASGRLQFYRMAFGSSGGGDGEYGLADMERVTRAFFSQSKADILWSSDRLGMSKIMARALLILTMLVGEALIIGGALKVDVQNDTAVISAEGERVKINAQVAQVLKGEGADIEPDAKTVPAFLLMELVEIANATILVEDSNDQRLVVKLSV